MEANRFDRLTRLLGAAIDRRRALGGAGLFAGLLAGTRAVDPLPGVEAAPSLCPAAPFKRCTQPIAKALAKAIQPCRQVCKANPKGRACKGCLRPHAEAAVAAAEECVAKVCRGGTAPEDEPQPAAAAGTDGDQGGRVAASAALPSCQSAQLNSCYQRRVRDTVICEVAAGVACFASAGAGCGPAMAVCFAQFGFGVADCFEDFGCQGRGSCTQQNVCCPTGTNKPCGETCCAPGEVCAADGAGGTQCCGRACSGLCCSPGESCAGGLCCAPERVCDSGMGVTKCCSPGDTCIPNLNGFAPPAPECCRTSQGWRVYANACCAPGHAGYWCSEYVDGPHDQLTCWRTDIGAELVANGDCSPA